MSQQATGCGLGMKLLHCPFPKFPWNKNGIVA